MLRSLIICPDRSLCEHFEDILLDIGGVGVLRVLEKYPHTHELLRHVRTSAPQILFVSAEDLEKTLLIIREMESNAPHVQLIVISRSADPNLLLELMRAGVREVLPLPFQPQAIRESIGRVREVIDKKPVVSDATELLFSFLPSKAGSGTTTVALNTAVALSRQPETNVLLADMDLNCGLLRFMLKLDNAYSVTDAAEHALNMDENLWPQLVSSMGKLDVLHSGRMNPGFRMEGTQIRHLLEFARRHYGAICIDHSGNMEKYSIEIMQESKRIFLVCTPEIPSLHLAREKHAFLKQLDLGDKVSVLLNRCVRRQVISPQQIEALLGMPVTMSLPNDYNGVHRALTAGKAVDPVSELGKVFEQLARSLVEKRLPSAAPVSETPSKKGGLLDFLNLKNSTSNPAPSPSGATALVPKG
jgi:pilus assembly protein CpaE